MEEETMTAKEAAEFLRISRTSLQRLIQANKLSPIDKPSPLLTRSKKLKFRREDVEALLAETEKAKQIAS